MSPRDPPLAPTVQVLVVDDVPEICGLFQEVLRRVRGVDVRVVIECNSQRALERVRSTRFDLVISDFRMRHVDGVEVLVAAREKSPDGLRILMTGYNEVPTSIDRIRSANVDAYLRKPLVIQDLLLLLGGLLRKDSDLLAAQRALARATEDAALAEHLAATPHG